MMEANAPTTPSPPTSDELDDEVQALNKMIINANDDDVGHDKPMSVKEISPTPPISCPIKVDIKPDDPNEIPYEVIPNRVFVGGFPLNTSEEEVRKIFSKWGEIVDVKIIKKEVSGQTKGYGFVTYVHDENAELVRAKESIKINGKKLNLGPAMRRLYPTLKEVKEQREREREQHREQMMSDGTETPSTTNGGTPPMHNGRRINSNNSSHGNQGYYKKYRKFMSYNNENNYYGSHPKPVPLLDIDMRPMYIAPFDLNKAISNGNGAREYQFLQCTIPMADHTLPAAIRQQFLSQYNTVYACPPY